MKPVIVGECNPYGSDPEYAMYPSPEGSSGHRLCCLILGMRRRDYLDNFLRVNLCHRTWNTEEAKFAAAGIQGERLVLLGSNVCKAFGVQFKPFTRVVMRYSPSRTAVILPHPSGLSRIWNEADSIARARATMALLGEETARLLGVATS